MKGIISRNPYTGQIKQQIAYFSDQILQKCFEKTSLALKLQANRQPKEKMSMIRQLIPQIQRNHVQISKLITFETGKPIVEAQNQIKQALKICEYYSKHSEAILSLNVKSNAKKKTLIKYMPLGTVYCILPFINPFSLTLYHTLPQLLLGNCVMVKNSSITPGVSKLIERIVMKSGFQSGQYQSLFVERDRSNYILGRSEIAGVNFTGSTQSGKKIGAIAGKNLKISSLQLSSNDAMIVMEDADLNLAIQNAIKIGFYNSGQASSPKRIIIKQSIYQQFKVRLIQKATKIIYGNPLDRQTAIGPLSTTDLYLKLQEQIKRIPSDFKTVFQRQNIQKPFFPITIYESEKNTPFDEQILGPVLLLLKAKENKQIIELANRTKYGNNHYVFSYKKGEQIIQSLRGGAIYWNKLDNGGCYAGKGGIRQSGYGRAGGSQGVRQFANIKTVYIN